MVLRSIPGAAILVLLLLLSLPAQSQETVLSAAGDVSGSGGTSSYSVGQAIFHLNAGSTGTVGEGVQQPYEILFMDGIGDTEFPLACRVYPNPALTKVVLSLEREDVTRFRYELRDIQGVLLEGSGVAGKEMEIPMAARQAGTYLLSLFEGNMKMATWKVIKK